MAERYVRMNVLSSGTEKAKASLDDLAERARALSAESPEIKATVNDTEAVTRMKDLKLKIDILNRERAEIGVEMKGDEKVKGTLLDIKARLRDLDEKVTPEIKLKDADKTEAQLIKIKLLMDAIHNKKVDLDVAKSGEATSFLSKLSRGANKGILGIPKDSGGGAGGESAAAGLLNGSPGAFLTNPIVAGPLGSLLLSLLPSVAGFGIGGLVGAGAVGGGLFGASQGTKVLKADTTNITQLQTALKSKSTPKSQIGPDKSALVAANKQFNTDSTFFEPFLEFQKTLQDLTKNLLAPLRSVMGPLMGIFAQFGTWLKSMGPALSAMFKASLPFVRAFMMVLEQGGKALIPAFTQAMNTMVKSGALTQMTQALVLLIKDGFVPFIKILGPGMKASAIIFKAVIIGLNGVLIALAAASTFIAREMEKMGHAVVDVGKVFYDVGRVIAALLGGNWKAMGNAVRALGDNFRNFFATLLEMLTAGFVKLSSFGRDVAHIFDNIRHAVSQAWDATWAYIGKEAQAAIMDDLRKFDTFRHDIAAIFDAIKRYVTSSWDQMFKQVENSAMQSFRAVSNDLTSWRHDISNGFSSLRHSVASTWDSMWADVKRLTSEGVRGVGEAIHGIENAFRTPVAFVVNDVWDRLAGIWNKITSIVHLGSLKLPTASFADGGLVTQGTGPRSDDVLARVSKGETVVSAAHSSVLAPAFSALGIKGYAAGGIPNPISAIGHVLSGVGHDILSWVTKPLNFIKQHLFGAIQGMLGNIPGSAMGMNSVLKSMTTSLIGALAGDAKRGISSTFGGKAFPAGPGLITVAKYIMSHGGTRAAGAGVGGVVAGESGGNPEAEEAGGGGGTGLIQWTPGSSAFPIQPLITGNVRRDMGVQLVDMLAYIRSRGGIGALNAARGPLGAAEAFSRMEAPLVPGSDIRASVVQSLFRQGYAKGGFITEPISGIGLHSGRSYSFGEKGTEYVVPHDGLNGRGGGDTYIINVSGDTDPDAAARRIHQTLRRYKTKRGGKALGLA